MGHPSAIPAKERLPMILKVDGDKGVSQDQCPMPAQILARLALWPQAGS
jgi:hypothetical protein